MRFKKLKPVHLDFKEMDRYYDVFIPLLMIETWSKVRQIINQRIKWVHMEIMPLRIAVACATWCHSGICSSGKKRSRPSYTVAIQVSTVLLYLMEFAIELVKVSHSDL